MLAIITYFTGVFHRHFGDIGTWFGSIATFSAVIFAYYQGNMQTKRYKDKQVREQAERISAWIAASKRPLPVKLKNSSDDPVFDAIVSIVLVQGAGPLNGKQSTIRRTYKTLPPGEFIVSFADYPGGGMHTVPGVELAFTDKSGVNWLKNKDGRLEKLDEDPAAYYGLTAPVGWLYFDDDQ